MLFCLGAIEAVGVILYYQFLDGNTSQQLNEIGLIVMMLRTIVQGGIAFGFFQLCRQVELVQFTAQDFGVQL